MTIDTTSSLCAIIGSEIFMYANSLLINRWLRSSYITDGSYRDVSSQFLCLYSQHTPVMYNIVLDHNRYQDKLLYLVLAHVVNIPYWVRICRHCDVIKKWCRFSTSSTTCLNFKNNAPRRGLLRIFANIPPVDIYSTLILLLTTLP